MQHKRGGLANLAVFGSEICHDRNGHYRTSVIEGEINRQLAEVIVEVNPVPDGAADGLEKNMNAGTILGAYVQPMREAEGGGLVDLTAERAPHLFGWLVLWFSCYGRRLPRRRWRRLLALRRSEAQIRASQIAVCDAAAHDISQYAHEPAAIGALSLIEAAHLFVNIAKQVERINADVGAFDRPLEQRPEVFQSVGMDLPAHVFPCVIDA